MSAKKKKYPRIPLGRWSLDLPCVFCGALAADGLIDRNGMPYMSCRECRTRSLSCGLRGVLSARFLGNLLANSPELREQWALEIARSQAELQRPVAEATAQARQEREAARAPAEKEG